MSKKQNIRRKIKHSMLKTNYSKLKSKGEKNMPKKQNIWKAKLIFTLLISIIYIVLLNSENIFAKETGRNTNNKSGFAKSFVQSTELLKLKINSPMKLGEYTVDKLQTDLQGIMQNSEKDIVFIENLGQIRDTKGKKRPDVLFLTRSQGVDMYITSSGITYVFRKVEGDIKDKDKTKDAMPKSDGRQVKTSLYRLDMEFVGKNKNIKLKKELAVEQHFNYYTPEYPDGISPKAYKKIIIENIYDGIDLVYYEKEGKIKYDFIVKAGADPGKIKMKYKGAGTVYIDKYGSLIVTTPLGEIREEKPYTYSRNTGKEIESGYEVKDFILQFDILEYDKSEDIIIDPYRIWATYYGGSSHEDGIGICADNSGALYVTGWTTSTNFPTKFLSGSYNQPTNGGGTDAFILKFNSSGARIWATYYGGSSTDDGNGICTDSSDALYVTGRTSSTNFPTKFLSGAYNQTYGGSSDLFILKFNSSGARIWATYYGGSYGDFGISICTDNSGALYVTGRTVSTNFPTKTLSGAYNQTTYGGGPFGDAFILRFSSSGARLWATYYGGSGSDFGISICTDNSGNLYITGQTNDGTYFPTQTLPGAYNQTTYGGGTYDAFILKFNSSDTIKWATYYGGSSYDYGNGICTDNPGNIYVTGRTASTNFPTQTLTGAYNQTTLAYVGYSDAFILKFNSSGARLWATYYGGWNGDDGNGICTDNLGALYVTGSTYSTNFPIDTLAGAYNQTTNGGGSYCDAFILKFDSSGARLWATYYGGVSPDEGHSICTDIPGNIYVTGRTASTNFPTKFLSGAYNQTTISSYYDAFILKFSPTLTGIKNISNEIPVKYSLHQNYPNPFNPTTKFKIHIAKLGDVKVVVFDLVGRKITTLVNEQLRPGKYEVEWDASEYTSGVYFYRIKAGEFVETKKMLMIK